MIRYKAHVIFRGVDKCQDDKWGVAIGHHSIALSFYTYLHISAPRWAQQMLEVVCIDRLRSENLERELTIVTVDNKVFHST